MMLPAITHQFLWPRLLSVCVMALCALYPLAAPADGKVMGPRDYKGSYYTSKNFVPHDARPHGIAAITWAAEWL